VAAQASPFRSMELFIEYHDNQLTSLLSAMRIERLRGTSPVNDVSFRHERYIHLDRGHMHATRLGGLIADFAVNFHSCNRQALLADGTTALMHFLQGSFKYPYPAVAVKDVF
jgi:hypothetical protein